MKHLQIFENYNEEKPQMASIRIEVKLDGEVIPHQTIDTVYKKDNSDIQGICDFIKTLVPDADRILVTKSVYNGVSGTYMEMDSCSHFGK
jgi:hypothetical protein